ncbi:MAG TPA: condensation domain-containing protein, partial [Gemmatimonadales bacterium]
PLANSRVYVLDRRLSPTPCWVSGELYVAGAGVARGYLGRPELTASRFLPDPWSVEPGGRMYATGDLGRHRPEGVLEFLGRDDDQLKLRGYRIEPGEVEGALRRHPEVAQAAVVGREDEPGDKRLVAYVVPRAGDRFSAPELRTFVSAILPAYMVPSRFVCLRSLPLSRNGKLDRRALPAPGEVPGEEGREPASPRNPFEEVLAGIWSEALRVERVGIEANFFDLGGHSLLATRVISRIREAFGVTLPVRALFDRPTVSRLAESIVEAMKMGEPSSALPLESTAREGPLPLSFAQQRLWFLDQLAPGNTVYNVPHAVVLTGALDLPSLGRSVGEIVRRHEVLRTTYGVVGGEPAARIGGWEAPAVPVVDLGGLGAAAAEETRRLARAEARRSFDLQRGPLLRLLVVRLGTASHALLSTMHHIVSDGWSTGILVRELSALYGAYLAGRASPLPELAIQYADFAAWQRRWLSGEVLASQLGYWKEQLAGVPVLDLPTDRPRPAQPSFLGRNHSLVVPQALCEGIRETARRHGATPFIVLMAVYEALLSRYTGQLDFGIGVPIAGRDRVETENLIGFFVNTLAMRANLEGDPVFLDLLKRAREVALEAYAHQELPLERLVQELAPERTLGQSPLFQVVLAFQETAREAVSLP